MFTSEAIKDRLKSHALKKYFRREEDIPADVHQHIDMLSLEMASLYAELNHSNDYIVREVKRSMYPSIEDRGVPAHKLWHFYPPKEVVLLNPEGEDHIFEEVRIEHGIHRSIFFTPLLKSSCHQIYPRYKVYRDQLAEFDNEGVENSTTNFQGDGLHQGYVWWGFEVGVTSPLENLNLYFDWADTPEEKKRVLNERLQLLPWWAGDSRVGISKGFHYQENVTFYDTMHLNEEHLFLRELEQTILKKFDDSFIHVEKVPVSEDTLQLPLEIARLLPENHGLELKKIWWVKMLGVDGFTPDVLDKLTIKTNVFPACNRKMAKQLTISVDKRVEHGVKLEERDSLPERETLVGSWRFLALTEVLSRHHSYIDQKPSTDAEIKPGYYRLKRGRIEAEDIRDIYYRILDLKNIFHEKSSMLRLHNDDDMEKTTKNLDEAMVYLSRVLDKAHLKAIDLGYYLRIFPMLEKETIWVRYWVWQGVKQVD